MSASTVVSEMEQTAQAADRECSDARPSPDSMRSRKMADVVMEPMDWLWYEMIPKGALTLITGDPGLGKSQMTLDFASRVSRGAPWPDGTAGSAPSTVLLLSCEDPAAQVLKPRLEAAGADMDRIIQIEAGVGLDGTEHHVSLETDLPGIEAMIKEYRAAMIIIDPLNAYLGRAETYKDNHVRSILGPLAQIAEEYGAAVVAIMHLNKDSSKSAMHRTMGSVAFGAAARASFLVSPDLEQGRVLLINAKANLTARPRGLAFVVESVTLTAPGGQSVETSRVVWQSGVLVDLTADQAMQMAKPKEPPKERPRDRAVAWLEKILTPGPMPAREAARLAEVEGISGMTLKRAKADLGIESTYSPETSSWTWALSPVTM